jgi:hypothetical protein
MQEAVLARTFAQFRGKSRSREYSSDVWGWVGCAPPPLAPPSRPVSHQCYVALNNFGFSCSRWLMCASGPSCGCAPLRQAQGFQILCAFFMPSPNSCAAAILAFAMALPKCFKIAASRHYYAKAL